MRTAVTCVCGSDLWPYRGAEPTDEPHPMGHEYVGFVEEVGSEVTSVEPGQFVVGSFATSDNTCANCRNGFRSNCLHREFMSTCQADHVRIPNAQGTLVATDGVPGEELWPGLLAVSDVMGTGWWAADAAEVKPGATAVVVGDGAVGLCAVIAAKDPELRTVDDAGRQEVAAAWTLRASSAASTTIGWPEVEGHRHQVPRPEWGSTSAPDSRTSWVCAGKAREVESPIRLFLGKCVLAVDREEFFAKNPLRRTLCGLLCVAWLMQWRGRAARRLRRTRLSWTHRGCAPWRIRCACSWSGCCGSTARRRPPVLRSGWA
ncbi:alcohol dehydrogenase catalytic domain-containing protein [Streptomyces sp. NPDC060030]|uniref:alcohol dehydrogenase catalytic domain-containing protein n=1 Tax=Streptomyces sp. NPDC060030 TaxID=3347042 RepID=UPI003680659E